MATLEFRKMHGLGNDFVVLDGRERVIPMTGVLARAIGDRHTGVGCDQIIVLEPPRTPDAALLMRIFNADGTEAGACGNATRCVASLVMEETGERRLGIETISGVLPAMRAGGRLIAVDMGLARLRWRDIPLAAAVDTSAAPAGIDEGLGPACCTSMGNPHATFFVPDADAVDLARLGPILERHSLFPERANIGIASLLGPDRLRLRVWERGVGLTLACGSGACAAVVAAARRGITGRRAEIVMERGSLSIAWEPNGHVLMTGPVATSFRGTLDLAALERDAADVAALA
jgi:diaminopimelate epimerase